MVEDRENLRHELTDSLKRFHDLFRDDTKLVRENAKRHGVKISIGGILTKPVMGQYNLRIPTGSKSEIDAIFKAKKVLVGCMDYRQSGEIADTEQFDILILNAGGGAQPSERRLKATANLLSHIHQVNPDAELVLLTHTRICGGVNYFTNHEIERVQKNGGEVAEQQFLGALVSALHKRITGRGVPKAIIRTGVAHIGEGNVFTGITTF